MATHKAVMRLAMEYASSIWSPLASSTSINKPKVIQTAALRTATGCTQDTRLYTTNIPTDHHTVTTTYIKTNMYHIHTSIISMHLANTHFQLHPHSHHVVTPGFVDRPRWSDGTAGQMDGEAGWWITRGKITDYSQHTTPTPTSKEQGSG